MSQLQQAIPFLREAFPYLSRHRGKCCIIAVPGEVLAGKHRHQILTDIASIAAIGLKLVLVFGARPQIEAKLSNTDSDYYQGMRITQAEDLPAIIEAIGTLRVEIESWLSFALSQPGFAHQGLLVSSGNFVVAKPIGVIEGVDLGLTGQVRRINTDAIRAHLDNDQIVLLSPLGYSPSGKTYNLQLEHLAIATAQKLKADKLLWLSHESLDLPSTLSLEQALHHTERLPHLAGLVKAMEKISARLHLMDATHDGALLLELFSREGWGTVIDSNPIESIQQAQFEDIPSLMQLIRPMEEEGKLIPRSKEQLERDINHFWLIKRDKFTIACAALLPWNDGAEVELACFVVDENHRQGNRGKKLLDFLIEKAIETNYRSIFVLTTQSVDWFLEYGFEVKPNNELPEMKRNAIDQTRGSQFLKMALK